MSSLGDRIIIFGVISMRKFVVVGIIFGLFLAVCMSGNALSEGYARNSWTHTGECWIHSGGSRYDCTYLKLTAVWDNYKCIDCYWAKKDYHYPNIYSFESPARTEYYGRALFAKHNGIINSLLKKYLDMGFLNKTYTVIIYFDGSTSVK